MRRFTPVLLALACVAAAAGPARAEDPLQDPIQLLERLVQPPARAVEKALRRPSRTVRTVKKAPTQVPASATAAAPPAAEPAQPEAPQSADLLSVPMPRLRPGDAGAPALGYAPASGLSAAPLRPQPPAPPLNAPPPAARSTCGVMLARLGVEAKALAPVQEGACAIPAPVSVSALDGGAVSLTTEALINCDFADALAAWIDGTVQPIAVKTLHARVTGLRIAASYACRNRDGLADAKLSEHARGNAIDISAFKLAGIGWIDVEHGWTDGGDRADFLRAVRASACGPFTTVLGPGSDSFHVNHFHLDRIKRRTAGPSRGLYCK